MRQPKLRICAITGDYSAELYAAPLMDAFLAQGHNVGIWGEQKSFGHYEDWLGASPTGIMGISDVLPKSLDFIKAFRHCKKRVHQFNPDIILLIDFAGFNMRLLKWAKSKGYHVVYYIPPKVWASRPNRMIALKKYCHQIITIFPFEQSYLNLHGINAQYFGNSHLSHLLDEHIVQKVRDPNSIAILPGSRIQELNHLLPLVKSLAQQFPLIQWKISKVPNIPTAKYMPLLGSPLPNNVSLYSKPAHTLLSSVSLALICSGTATIEAAVLDCPQIILYRTSALNYQIGKRIIRTQYIGLPNLMLNKEIVPELIQDECTAHNIIKMMQLIGSVEYQKSLHFYYQAIQEAVYKNDAVSTICGAILTKYNKGKI